MYIWIFCEILQTIRWNIKYIVLIQYIFNVQWLKMNRIFFICSFIFFNTFRAYKWEKYLRNQKNGRLLFCCIEPVQIHMQSLSIDLLLMCRVVIGTVETVSWLNAESVCVRLSLSLQSWPHARFVSQHQCALTSLSPVPHTRVCYRGQTQGIHTSLTFALLSVVFPFLFRF